MIKLFFGFISVRMSHPVTLLDIYKLVVMTYFALLVLNYAGGYEYVLYL